MEALVYIWASYLKQNCQATALRVGFRISLLPGPQVTPMQGDSGPQSTFQKPNCGCQSKISWASAQEGAKEEAGELIWLCQQARIY